MTFLNKTKSSSIIPKYVNYYNDGFGRDTYVKLDNGGFLNKIVKVKSIEKFDVNIINRYINTKKNVAPFKYRSDGTGRDNYVLHEHGGLERDQKSLKNFQLKDFLRNPESTKFNFFNDPLKEGVNEKTLYESKREFYASNKNRTLEKDLAYRLYYNEQEKFIDRPKKRIIKYHLSMRDYNDGSKNNNNTNKNKNFSNISDSDKKLNLPLASKSANNFYNISKSKIRNKYVEEANQKIELCNKNYAKDFLLKTKSISKLKNYDSYMMPPTANDKLLFSTMTIK